MRPNPVKAKLARGEAQFGTMILDLSGPGLAKIFENATDYSVNNTTRNALFLRTTREAKYKAKAAIDTFFMRGGDVAAAGAVFLVTQQWQLELGQFATMVVGIVVIWLYICWRLKALYGERKTA